MEGKFLYRGEISLAHLGVLFLDELPEFHRHTLELLREPLEDRKITISRLNATLTYPCQFILIASMNPCPCGYFGSNEKNCVCLPQQISRYINKISGPLLDRIDININVNSIKYAELSSSFPEEKSSTIKERVNFARNIQRKRYKEYNILCNAELTQSLIQKFCDLDAESSNILQNAFKRLSLSARGYNRILKVARTIADLDNKKNIQTNHIAEAIQYRILDKQYWKQV